MFSHLTTRIVGVKERRNSVTNTGNVRSEKNICFNDFLLTGNNTQFYSILFFEQVIL